MQTKPTQERPFSESQQSTLRNISIPPIILPLHIILLNQTINIPLNIRHAQHTSTNRRLNNLTHKLRVPNRLPALHDAHDRRLRLEVPVFCDAHVRFFVFFFGLFELDLVDLDAVFGVREVWVEGEGVGRGDVFAFGVFGEGTEFGAGEGLEGAFYFVFSWEGMLVL